MSLVRCIGCPATDEEERADDEDVDHGGDREHEIPETMYRGRFRADRMQRRLLIVCRAGRARGEYARRQRAHHLAGPGHGDAEPLRGRSAWRSCRSGDRYM